MRFTVKAKLASAFGAVILLSMITGGVAYNSLSSLTAQQERIVGQATRTKLAADVMDAIQGQQRAETRMIQAVSDKETQDNHNAMLVRREKTLKLYNDLHGQASDNGKRMLDQASGPMKRMNEFEDQTGKFALLNSNNKAAELWKNEGQAAAKDLDLMFDAAVAELSKGASENQRVVTAMLTAHADIARLSRAIVTAYSATSTQELEVDVKEATQRLNDVKAAAAQAGQAGAAAGINAQSERLAKVVDNVTRLALEAGNMKAAAVANGEGRKVFNETLGAIEQYAKLNEKQMAEVVEEGAREAALAKTLLISMIIGALLIAVASATWIALNISRGLGRAVDLAKAVAVGDLSQKISVSSNDEVGDLVSALNAMTTNLSATAAVASEIAQGNLTVEAKALSDKDTLGLALERMVEKLRQIVS
jgi:methyl-accepting chemotaxis protein